LDKWTILTLTLVATSVVFGFVGVREASRLREIKSMREHLLQAALRGAADKADVPEKLRKWGNYWRTNPSLAPSRLGGYIPGGEEVRGMQSIYRKHKGSDTWHFCSNCSNWPTSSYDTHPGKPASGELCNECLGKQRNNNCA
jgi:hypothetical protein